MKMNIIMKREEVIEKVKSFLVEEFEIDEGLLEEDKLIFKEIGIDSLDLIDIVVRVKEEFGFKLERTDFAEVKTLGDFYDLLMKKIDG